jgi:hypothetical protein
MRSLVSLLSVAFIGVGGAAPASDLPVLHSFRVGGRRSLFLPILAQGPYLRNT